MLEQYRSTTGQTDTMQFQNVSIFCCDVVDGANIATWTDDLHLQNKSIQNTLIHAHVTHSYRWHGGIRIADIGGNAKGVMNQRQHQNSDEQDKSHSQQRTKRLTHQLNS